MVATKLFLFWSLVVAVSTVQASLMTVLWTAGTDSEVRQAYTTSDTGSLNKLFLNENRWFYTMSPTLLGADYVVLNLLDRHIAQSAPLFTFQLKWESPMYVCWDARWPKPSWLASDPGWGGTEVTFTTNLGNAYPCTVRYLMPNINHTLNGMGCPLGTEACTGYIAFAVTAKPNSGARCKWYVQRSTPTVATTAFLDMNSGNDTRFGSLKVETYTPYYEGLLSKFDWGVDISKAPGTVSIGTNSRTPSTCTSTAGCPFAQCKAANKCADMAFVCDALFVARTSGNYVFYSAQTGASRLWLWHADTLGIVTTSFHSNFASTTMREKTRAVYLEAGYYRWKFAWANQVAMAGVVAGFRAPDAPGAPSPTYQHYSPTYLRQNVDRNLNALAVRGVNSGLLPAPYFLTLNYNVKVPFNVTSVAFQYTFNRYDTRAVVSNATALVVGRNSVPIKVYGVDPTLGPRVYTVVVERFGPEYNACNMCDEHAVCADMPDYINQR